MIPRNNNYIVLGATKWQEIVRRFKIDALRTTLICKDAESIVEIIKCL